MEVSNYITQFEKECYQPALTKMVQKLNSILLNQMTEIEEKFEQYMTEAFRTITSLQEKGILGELQTMSLSFLFTSLYQNKPAIMLELYEEVPFLEDSLFSYRLPADWLFPQWEAFYEDLLQETSKRGLRRFIRPSMIRRYTWKTARMVVYYGATILKYWMRKIVETDAFTEMKLADRFFITYGEYMDWQQRIYGQQEEVDIFNCEDDTDLTFRQFEDKWYEEKEFKSLCLDDSYFQNCTFIKCTFDKTTLNDVRFVDCTFNDCTFNEVLLYGTTFINSQLSHIKWQEIGIFGSGEEKEIKRLYGATDFIGCHIESLEVKNTHLTGSRWRNCSIEDVEVENVKMTKEIKRLLGIKEEEGE